MAKVRYEIDHQGRIVESETELCSNRDAMIISLFSQYGWRAEEIEKEGPYMKLKLSKDDFEDVFVNVFSGNIRNEDRNSHEKKIQLNGKDPRGLAEQNTIIIGVYTYKKDDSLSDALFVGYPIDQNVKYDTNPSLRGAFVNGVLVKGKNKGFYFDEEKNLAAFRPEFIFYYLDNYKKLHYGSSQESTVSVTVGESGRLVQGTNIILYGVPGCGKSHEIKTKYCNDKKYMERVVFHPDYTYSDFIGQILPKTDGENISYPFTPGPFTVILDKAICDPGHMYYLVIEEINRGNAPAIFGEVFQLLDRENGESEYGINNFDIAGYIYGKDETEREIKIPSNLTIIATMNTADQNVFTLDTAFKRRWTLRSIENNIHGCKHAKMPICDTAITWEYFATKINDTIIDIGEGSLGSEDNRLGAYFVKAEDLQDQKAFAEKVLMYLWNDAFKYDRDKIFKSEYRTLEELLRGFYAHKFDIFNTQLGFNDVVNESISSVNTLGEEEYLQNKKPEQVNLYISLKDMIKERIPDLFTYTTNSKQYIGIGAKNITRKSFAEVILKSGYLSIEIEKPTIESLLELGDEIEYNGSHDHYFKLSVTKDSDLNLVVSAIVNSYEQLKKDN